MQPGVLEWLGLGWWAAGTGLHWLTAGLARRPRPPAVPPAEIGARSAADFSVVAPMKGTADASFDYVKCLQRLAEEGAEILICVSGEDDAAIAEVRSIWPEAPILVGSDTT